MTPTGSSYLTLCRSPAGDATSDAEPTRGVVGARDDAW